MPGAVAAIVAARRTRGYARPPPRTSGIDGERWAEMQKEVEKRKKLTILFKKYDTNGSKKLERDQIINLLTDLDAETPSGTKPTDDEVDFILKVADQSGDDCLSRKELEHATQAWHVYTKKRALMEDKIKEFDKSGTGKLEKPELKEYLVSLNGGQPVTDEEVEWVFSEADLFGDGAIRQTELVMATAAWYVHVEKKKSACCTVL
mmetsp:Transcript_4368/g.7304  ORF Transcript_4368/g.7304 Transcript_4368/m.7304 type:complete len:205 (-) Transcript_4368:43-657(-)